MRKLYGKFGYIDFVPEPDFDIRPGHRPDRSHPDRRRRQAVLRPPHRFLRQHHHARQGHPPRNPARRRRHVQYRAVGLQHPAPEPARLFRNAEEGRSRRHQAQSAVQHGGHHAQGERARQELHRPERRRLAASPAASSGFNYSTNNFLGLGETLSLESQLGTRMRDVSLGFTEPYFLDRPLQLGFVVYLRRFNFDQGREASILSGQNLIPLYNQLGSQNLLNYSQNSHGFSVSASYPHQAQLRPRRRHVRLRHFQRRDHAPTAAQGLLPVHQLQRRRRTELAERNPHQPHRSVVYLQHGQPSDLARPPDAACSSPWISRAASWAATSTPIRPSIDVKYFKQAPWHKSHILAFHVLGSLITGYGGKFVPPFSRTYIGGEQDIRGFEIWGITPIAFVASSAQRQCAERRWHRRARRRWSRTAWSPARRSP